MTQRPFDESKIKREASGTGRFAVKQNTEDPSVTLGAPAAEPPKTRADAMREFNATRSPDFGFRISPEDETTPYEPGEPEPREPRTRATWVGMMQEGQRNKASADRERREAAAAERQAAREAEEAEKTRGNWVKRMFRGERYVPQPVHVEPSISLGLISNNAKSDQAETLRAMTVAELTGVEYDAAKAEKTLGDWRKGMFQGDRYVPQHHKPAEPSISLGE